MDRHYLGVTSDLVVRVNQHKTKEFTNSFTAKYNPIAIGCNKLVYYEIFCSIEEAIAREKAVIKWNREWKNKLIRTMNPEWNDLSLEVMNW